MYASLGKLLMFFISNQRTMHIDRLLPAKGMVQPCILRSRGQIFISSDHMGNLHQMIVNDIGKIISPAVFDMTKLRWMNGEYMKALDEERYLSLALPYVKQVIHKDLDLNKIAMLVKTRIETFCDIAEKIDFFEELPEYDTEMYVHKNILLPFLHSFV